ncbi:MAG: ATP-binding protein, partial [Desulfosarcinaceae bacterium]
KSAEGLQPVPLHDGQPLTREAFEQLPESEREGIEKAMAELNEAIAGLLRKVRENRQAMAAETDKLFAQVARYVVHDRVEAIREDYRSVPDVLLYLQALEDDIVENVALFLPAQQPAAGPLEGLLPGGQPSLDRYRVNILVDRAGAQGAPVIFEPNPSFRNLFGWIEKRFRMGAVIADFSMVQAGALLQANGGFLIMEIESVLMNPLVWEALKRALQNKQLFIEDPGANDGPSTAALRPQPIGLDLKIILIGGYPTFELLQNNDPKFNELFKVRADFDYEAADSPETVHQYACFIARVCSQEDLLHFSPDGVSAVVEYCKKIAGHQKKLSLRFGPVVSIIKEADYWARESKADLVTSRHVYRAFEQHRFRYNLYEEKVHQSYVEKTVLIDVQGEVVGQVNALAVYQMGEISFGRPSRITAETYMGKNGIINIEREARMSGSTHDKGVMILSGYLGRTFARNQPMCLCASLTFEQNYGGVDGDSASSTELYAILSSLADTPIRQGLAVTGSVNQKGAVQAIGGVNQKIEGFFEVCKSLGLSGLQGVLIPAANVQNLMLKQEVIEAVAAGRFHIYPVTSIEQGLEILTGVPTGSPDENGGYPEGTLYHRVQQRLAHFYRQALQWQKAADAL